MNLHVLEQVARVDDFLFLEDDAVVFHFWQCIRCIFCYIYPLETFQFAPFTNIVGYERQILSPPGCHALFCHKSMEGCFVVFLTLSYVEFLRHKILPELKFWCRDCKGTGSGNFRVNFGSVNLIGDLVGGSFMFWSGSYQNHCNYRYLWEHVVFIGLIAVQSSIRQWL